VIGRGPEGRLAPSPEVRAQAATRCIAGISPEAEPALAQALLSAPTSNDRHLFLPSLKEIGQITAPVQSLAGGDGVDHYFNSGRAITRHSQARGRRMIAAQL